MDRSTLLVMTLVFLVKYGECRSPKEKAEEIYNSMTPKDKESADCPRDNYCAGENFPERIRVAVTGELDYAIRCSQEEDIRSRCCLGSNQHLVCYDINAEGQLLNYSNTTNFESTDFSGLCQAMLATLDPPRQPGRYFSAALKAGVGDVVFRNGNWASDIEFREGDQHIRHLACSIEE